MRSSGCCFCSEFAGERTEFHDLYPDLASRLILDGPNFVVMPSLGQLAPGHMLLVPRQHVTSFGELDVVLRSEALSLYLAWRQTLSEHFSSTVCFEHGSPPGASSGGCGIVHAHIHIVPLAGIQPTLPPAMGDGWRESSGSVWLDEAAAVTRRAGGYLMWHGPGEAPHLETATDVPSQHLRRHVARVLGENRWDWRTAGRRQQLAVMLSGSTRHALASAAAVS
jgi:diadenosine tetraphosphate (Ap4A) HIT family hydrolase